MFLFHTVSNCRYLREDLTEVAAQASQQIGLHTASVEEGSKEEGNTVAHPEGSSASRSQSVTTLALNPEELSAVSAVFREDILE